MRAQVALTTDGVDMLAAWASGEEVSGTDFRVGEDIGETAQRNLVITLREAFITPIEPEDLFAISRGFEWILDGAGDLVAEADVLEGRTG